MKTEEERFEEWWSKNYAGMTEGFGSREAWMARAALDRPKLGMKIWRKDIEFKEYLMRVGKDDYRIRDEEAVKLVGRELSPGEEIEI